MRAAACMHACTCPGAEWSDDSGFIYSALIVSYDCLAGGGGGGGGGGHASRHQTMTGLGT